jgi:hypothetical protein
VQVGSGANAKSVEFTCRQPNYVYDSRLAGWIPRVQYPVFGRTCLTQHAHINATVTRNDNEFSPAARRLLSEWKSELLSNTDTNNVGRRLLWNRAQTGQVVEVAAGLAIATGGPSGLFVGGLMLAGEALFGGSGGGMDADEIAMLKSLQVEISGIQDQLDNMKNWEQTVVQFEAETDTAWIAQDREDSVLQSDLAITVEAVQNLNDRVGILANVTGYMQKEITDGFAQVKKQFVDQADIEGAIWNNTIQLIEEAETRIKDLSGRSATAIRFIRDLDVRSLAAYKDTTMRRAILELFWQLESIETPRPSAPFVSYIGSPPTTTAERVALRSLNGARVLSSVFVMRTVPNLGNEHAQLLNISYVCNVEFLVNNVVSQLDFQAVFDFLGPANCYPNDPNAPWGCQCAVVVETRDCKLVNAGPPVQFPYGWQETGSLFSPNDADKPDNYVSHCVPADLTTQSTIQNGLAVVLETPDKVTNYIKALCGDTVITDASFGRAGYPFKMRVFASNTRKYIDLPLDTTYAGTDVCAANYMGTHLPGAKVHEVLSYTFMQLWIRSYTLAARLDIPTLEERVFGRIASDLNFQYSPFDSNAREQQTFRCTGFSHARIGTDPNPALTKLPVYAHLYSHSEVSVQVRVSDQLIQDYAVAGSTRGDASTSSIFRNLTSSGNVTVSTNVQLSGDAVTVLPVSFQRIGKYLADPVDPGATWDAPLDLMSIQTNVAARNGHLTYIFQGANWNNTNETTPITISQWQSQYGTYFDANSLGADPTRYKRKLEIGAGGGVACGKGYDHDGVTETETYDTNGWCSMLRHYDVVTDNSAIGQVSFKPKEYTYTATVTVPGGTFVERSLSICPSALNVTVVAGDVHIHLTTTSLEEVQLRIVVDNPLAPGTSCRLFDDTRYFSVLKPIDLRVEAADACQPMYMNANPVDSIDNCYRGKGILVQTSHSLSGGAGTPGVVEHAVAVMEDEVIDDLVKQMIDTSEYIWALNNLHYSDAEDEAIEAAVEALIAKRTGQLANMTLPGERQSAFVEEQMKRISAKGQEVTDDLNKVRGTFATLNGLSAKIGNATARMDYLEKVLTGEWDKVNESNAAGHRFQEQFIKASNKLIADFQKDEDSGCSLGPLCVLTDLLGDIFGGIFGGILSMLLHVGLMILGAYVLYYLLKKMVAKCGKKATSSETTGGHLETDTLLETQSGKSSSIYGHPSSQKT